MYLNQPEFKSNDNATILAVVLHAYRSSRNNLNDIINSVDETYATNERVDIYAPTLPYKQWWDYSGANNIVVNLVQDIDEIWKKHKYHKIIFIGHSMGGVLLRRVFLAAAPNSPDYSGTNLIRDDLPKEITGEPHEWAAKIERIILLASWDRGWSISERDAWKYTLGLNLLGFWGRFTEIFGLKTKPGRTMLDMRQGGSFIVQTRLLWMAYQRWQIEQLRNLYNKAHPVTFLDIPPREAVNPILIQVIGNCDDFVSPQDQVDYDVNAIEKDVQRSDPQFRNNFLLEMPGADHGGVVDFTSDGGDLRKKVFLLALMADRPQLLEHSRDPSYFEDVPIKPDPTVKDVVFVIHGIRDDGYWTHRIAKTVKEAAAVLVTANITDDKQDELAQQKPEHIVSWTQTYGYFPMGAFLLPWIRQQKVEWFMDKYVNVKARYPNATMHYVGHSNGTYLAASALNNYPAARFGQVYFAGCVVHPKFDWSSLVEMGRVKRFHNVLGMSDWVVALLPKSIEYFTDLGGAGFDGFEQAANEPKGITQSVGYATGGHSGAISEYHWPEIAKFIVTGQKPFASEEPSELFATEPHYLLKFFARFRIGIPFAFSLTALLILFDFTLWLPVENWNWKVSNLTQGWGVYIWANSFVAFLLLQYFSKEAPTKIKRWLSTLLICIITFGVANLVFTSFFHEVVEFAKLDTHYFAVAFRTTGAVFTLVGLLAFLRFILTRF